jgi:hypothetical protein
MCAQRFLRQLIRLWAIGVFCLIAVSDTNAQSPTPSDTIIGQWRGTSICTDRKLAPACTDETIQYIFTHLSSNPREMVHLNAQKLVVGEYATMYEMDLRYDQSGQRWQAAVESPRIHALWSYAVQSNHLTGTLLALPSNAVIREVRATRY